MKKTYPLLLARYFLSIIFLTGFSASALCQQGKTSPGEHRIFPDRNTYSLGINTQFAIDGLLDQSTFTPMEILWRKGTKNNQALRARLKGMLTNTDRNDEQERRKIHQSHLALALGYEWHRPLGNRFGYYYGGELEMGVNNDNVTRHFINNTSIGDFFVKRTDFEKTRRIGVLPIAGFTYNPLSGVFVSLEMRLEIFYEKLKFTSDSFIAPIETPNDSMPGSWGRYNITSWKLNFQPYSGIFINLEF
ncbi:hypothetical protein [Negadavirga shengliensis]|uniref:Uncharacterized protein n=1 Tax=Negadavirga shengliensis TaxID=1389218 RepID=A0ABV9T0G6_9BACT